MIGGSEGINRFNNIVAARGVIK